ncbi:MAG: Rne/Rng family ribonuclease [Bacteroidales bacterium]|nr:Rne/Rng family ribonuclease [Bacteroidales bacterium]
MSRQNEETHSELYIDVHSSEINIALLHNKKLVELSKERSNIEFSVGDIYLGKVKRLMPGLNAAFIDVGYKRDAFLHYLDLGAGFQTQNKFLHIGLSKKQKNIRFSKIKPEADIDKYGKITDVLTVGQYVLVQIAKEPISSKGPRLSCELSIAGRNLVLMPFGAKISVSQKIKSVEERKRLKRLIESITPLNYGVIVRTVAETKMVADLDKELNLLIEKWETLYSELSSAKPPKLMIGEINRTTAILRDILNSTFNQIYVNDKTTYEGIKDFITEIAPEKSKIVKLYNAKEPIFDYFDIEKQIKTSFGKTVPMRNGAYLIIEHTEAAHVIDVNSGNRSNSEQDQEENATEVNLIAAEEIARQLRLRDMGGIIIVDFIDIHNEKNKRKVFDKLKETMEGDRAKFHIIPLSKFCVMEITRQRVRPEMDIKTSEKCPCCNGSGKIGASISLTDEIENSLKFIIKKHKSKEIIIKTHPFVYAYLTKGLIKSMRKIWQKSFNCKITIKPMMVYSYMEYHFFNSADEELFY